MGNSALSPPGQPQVHPPGPCTLLLPNGAGRGLERGGATGTGNGTGNGTCRAVPGGQKPPRKLQQHHSINSQSSKKSKGSSKSPSSHIPIEAQEGTARPLGGSFCTPCGVFIFFSPVGFFFVGF